jgi:alpha-D-ribose 1-methylphosphonate 5-triphosphate diphosphatase PhnM
MDADIKNEAAKLSDALAELAEEIDLACDDDATAEEIEETRALSVEVLSRWSVLLGRTEGSDRTELQRSIGLKVAKIEGLLTRLPSG